MKKCMKCNNLVEDDLELCDKCGYSFVKSEELEVCEAKKACEEKKDISLEENECDSETIESIIEQGSSNGKEIDELSIEEKDSNNVQGPEVNSIDESTGKDCIKKRMIKPAIIINTVCILAAVICLLYSVNMNSKYSALSEDYASVLSQIKNLEEKNKTLGNENTDLERQITQLESENNELANGAQKQLSEIRNAYENGEWQKVIDLANTLHENYNGSEEDAEAQQLAQTSQENIDIQKAEEEAEKARGYETGITYDQLARTPNDYIGKKVKFSGKVVQVIEGADSVQIRLAVNNDYDTILLGEYDNSIVASRILEDDKITIYGTSVGTISYKSTLGGTITIPGVYIDKVDQ